MTRSIYRGASRCEVLSVVACAAIFAVIVSVVFGQSATDGRSNKNAVHPKSVKDATQVRGIHQAWLVFSNEFQGIFPTPGLIDRLPVEGRGEVPGRGSEDISQNTTANLYSMLIMNNYFTPEIVVSPVERNPKVQVKKDDYNYEAYNVPNDVYWDSQFRADLVESSNASYAHMPLTSARKAKEWKNTANSKWPIVSNRGPKDGKLNPSSFTCGPHGHWAGNVVYNDNHVEFFEAVPNQTDSEGTTRNFFSVTGAKDGSALLTFTKVMSETEPEFQFD